MNRVYGDRTREARPICSPAESCACEVGRGDTMVEGTSVAVVVVGVDCAFGA